MREHRKVPKRLIRHKFRRNLEEFKTKAETPVVVYDRKKLHVNKILEEIDNDIQPERQEWKEAVRSGA